MLQNQRNLFRIPREVTYLNCAYMSPLAKSVEAAGATALTRKRNPIDITPDDFFTDSVSLRKEYARLINANDPNRIVVIPSVSYGMANVAKNIDLEKGDEIVVVAEEFPSNYYPWERKCEETGAVIKTVSPPDSLERRGEKWNIRLLEAIGPKTKVVAVGNVHWADGTRFNLKEIRKRTRDVGAALIVDGSQSVGAMPLDVEDIQPDALICVGYKWMLGPYSSGLGWYGPMFDNGKPIEESWMNRMNSEDFRSLVIYEPQYQPGSFRYNVGEFSSFIHTPMQIAALKLINKWKPANIQKYCKKITADFIKELRSQGFWIEDEDSRGQHLIGVRLPEGFDVPKLSTRLRKNKVSVSLRGNNIRVGANVYNTEKDLGRLAEIVLKK